jgi:hypothetical protein
VYANVRSSEEPVVEEPLGSLSRAKTECDKKGITEPPFPFLTLGPLAALYPTPFQIQHRICAVDALRRVVPRAIDQRADRVRGHLVGSVRLEECLQGAGVGMRCNHLIRGLTANL